MVTSALEELSVPITFVATIIFAALAFVVAVWPAVLPLDLGNATGLIYAAATLAFALILTAVSGNPRPAGDLDVPDRNFLVVTAELIIWACAPVALIFQQYAPESGRTITLIMAALFVISAIVLMFHLKAKRQCSFGEVVLIPITAISGLLLAGGGWLGSGFLESAIPGEVLDTNMMLRLILGGAVVIWLVAGMISGLRDNFPNFRNVLMREGAGRNILVTIDVFIQFCWEVIFSVARALGSSFLKIVNGRSGVISILLSISICLWILIVKACERFSQDGPSYFNSHEYDLQVVIYFVVFIAGVVISAWVDELSNDGNITITDGIERASRFVPIFSSVLAALFFCSLMSLVIFEIVGQAHFVPAGVLTTVGGFAPAPSFSFLVIVPVLMILRSMYRLLAPRS